MDVFSILDFVVEDCDIAIYDVAKQKYTSNRPMTIEEAEDYLSEIEFAFDSIEAKNNMIVINIEKY